LFFSHDRKPWTPTKNSRICSAHFEGGEKSDHPQQINYVPTIFPSIYKKKRLDPSRAKRLQQRKAFIESRKSSSQSELVHENDVDMHCEVDVSTSVDKRYSEVAIQTDFFENQCTDSHSILMCHIDGKNSSTQTDINIISKSITKNKIINKEELISAVPKVFKNAASGPDSEMSVYFGGIHSIKNENSMKKVTGVSLLFFSVLLDLINPGEDGQPKYFKKLGKADRLLLSLMKLKLGLSFSALGVIFNVSRQSASDTFFSILKTLNLKTKTWLFWPSKEAIKETMPESFKNYPNCRAIIDCTEFHCDTPPKVEQRILMYSSYKGGFTIKYLIAISPSGLISFISKGYGGRATDSFIVNDSGFLNMLQSGDEVMADKGFPQIKTELLQRECTLVMPPFAFNQQFTEQEVLQGHAIASVRIHVERAIQRIKIFKILQHVNVDLFDKLDDIVYFICIIVNNKEPLIQEK